MKIGRNSLWVWVLISWAAALVGGCARSHPEQTEVPRAIQAVQESRTPVSGLSLGSLVDVYTAEQQQRGQTVLERQWSAQNVSGTWKVAYTARTSREVRVAEWKVDLTISKVEPSNDLARDLEVYDKDLATRLFHPAVAAAPPAAEPPPAPTPVYTPPPPPAPTPEQAPSPAEVTPVPQVTVTVTATPPAPSPVATAPPPPPKVEDHSDVMLQGTMRVDGAPVALLNVAGQFFEAHAGENLTNGYKVVSIRDREVTMLHNSTTFDLRLAPNTAPEFIPANPTPLAPPSTIK